MEPDSTKDTLDDIRKKFVEVNDLLRDQVKYSNESEPYKIKYQAIEILKTMETNLMNILTNTPEDQKEEIIIMLGVVHLYRGILHVDTEESKAGEEQFMKCIKLLEDKELNPKGILVILGALNQLGIVWSQWNQPLKAQGFLERAEQIYNDFKNTNQQCKGPVMMAQCFGIETSKNELTAIEMLEKIHTLTLYYLAQVYSSLKDHWKGAIYFHMTLRRQLGQKDMKDLDYIDWALNAATLSQYFMENDAFSQARHHLAAASYILQEYEIILKEKAENNKDSDALTAEWESFKHRSADVARCWAKYGILLLNLSKQRLLQKSETEQENVELDKDSSKSKMIDGLKFDALEKNIIEPIENQVTDQYLLTFDDARLVFLNAQKWLNEAKSYYTLENHASDHVSIIQDMSHAYQYLAFFEEQEDRQAKMHKRRIDILENIIKELNPQYYKTACRQIWTELGETYTEILDIKLDRLRASDEKPTPQALAKINHLANSAIKNFQALLDSLETRNSSSEMEPFPDDAMHPALCAYFYLGRLYNKIITPDKTIQLENTQKSFNAYKFVVDYCDKYPKAAEAMRVELNLCRELVVLLPMKISRLREMVANQ